MIKYWTTSGNVELTEYEAKTESLIIQYRDGKRYLYRDVPRNVWDELKESNSIGSFLYREIKGKYGYVEVS